MSETIGPSGSSTDQAQAQGILEAAFGLSYELSREKSPRQRSFLLQVAIEYLQLLHFAVLPTMAVWEGTAGEDFGLIASVLAGDVGAQPALFPIYVALILVGSMLALWQVGASCAVAWMFLTKRPHSALLLSMLRLSYDVTTRAMFLPVSFALATSLTCRGAVDDAETGGWTSSGIECSGAASVIIRILIGILYALFVVLNIYVAGTAVDRSPASQSWDAMPTGRSTMTSLLGRTLLCLAFTLLVDQLRDSQALPVLLLLLGLVQTSIVVRSLPFTHSHMNAVAGGGSMAFLWAAAVLSLRTYFDTGDLSLTLFLGLPLSFTVGALTTHIREYFVAAQPLSECSDLVQVDVWARHRMQAYAKRVESRGALSHGGLAAAAARSIESSVMGAMDDLSAAVGGGNSTSRTIDAIIGDGAHSAGLGGRTDTEIGNGSLGLTSVRVDTSAYYGRRLINTRYDSPAKRMDDQLLYAAEQAYRHMRQQYNSEPIAHLLAGEFYHGFYHETAFAEAQCLSSARLRSPGLDLQSFAYQRTYAIREDVDQSSMSALDRVVFEQLAKKAQESKIAAMRSILGLWEQLARTQPVLSRVVAIGENIESTLGKTERLYKQMMSLSSGAMVCRVYAEFLMDLRNDAVAAMELFNRADRIDERNAKQRARAVRHVVLGQAAPHVDQLDDTAAGLTLSAKDGSIGEVLSASPAACRLLGHANTSQLVGSPFTTMLPEPIRAVYRQRISELQNHGWSNNLNKTEVTFVQHTNGSAIPVVLSLMEATPELETSSARLAVTMDQLRCDENVVFFAGADQGYRVLSATARSLLMMGVEGEAVGRDTIPLTRYFPTVEMDGMQESAMWNPAIMLALLGSDQDEGSMMLGQGGGSSDGEIVSSTDADGTAPTQTPSADATVKEVQRVHLADLTPEQRQQKVASLDKLLVDEIRRRIADEAADDGPIGSSTPRGGERGAGLALPRTSSRSDFITQLQGLSSSTRRMLQGTGATTSGKGAGGGGAARREPSVPPLLAHSSDHMRQTSTRSLLGTEIPQLPSRLLPRPLLSLKETGLVPLENTNDGSNLLLASVQDVSAQVGKRCYMLRWRSPNEAERGVMRSAARKTLLNSELGQAAMEAIGLEDKQEDVSRIDEEDDEGDMGFLGGAWSGLKKGNIDGPKSAMRKSKAKGGKKKKKRRVSVTFGAEEEIEGAEEAGSEVEDSDNDDRAAGAVEDGTAGGSSGDAQLAVETGPAAISGEKPSSPVQMQLAAEGSDTDGSSSSSHSGSKVGADSKQLALPSAPGMGAPLPLRRLERDSFASDGSGSLIDPFSSASALGGGGDGVPTPFGQNSSEVAPGQMGPKRGPPVIFGARQSGDGDGRSSVSSSKSWMAQQLSKVVQNRNSAADQEVSRIRTAFVWIITIILALGITGIALQRTVGNGLQNVSTFLYVNAEQAVSFQSFFVDYRVVAAHFDPRFGESDINFIRFTYDVMQQSALYHREQHELLITEGESLGETRAKDILFERRLQMFSVNNDRLPLQPYTVSLYEMGEFMTAVVLRISHQTHANNLTFIDPDYTLLAVNQDSYLTGLNESLSLRSRDVADVFRLWQVVVGVAGLSAFILVLVVAAVLFARSLAELRSKTMRVIGLLMYMPIKIAKQLKTGHATKLQQLVQKFEGLDNEGEFEEDNPGFGLDDDLLMQGDQEGDLGAIGASDQGASLGNARSDERGMRRLLGSTAASAAAAARALEEEEERWRNVIQANRQASRRSLGGEAARNTAPAAKTYLASSSGGGTGTASSGATESYNDLTPKERRRRAKFRKRRSSRMVDGLRSFTDDWSFTLWTTGRFMIPVMLSFCWVVFLVISTAVLFSGVTNTNERLVLAERLSMDTVRFVQLIQDYAYDSTNVTRPLIRETIDTVEDRLIIGLRRIVSGGTYYDESTGLTLELDSVQDPTAQRLLLDDACSGSEQYEECRAAGDGIMMNGVQTSLNEAVRELRTFVNNGPQPGADPFPTLAPYYFQPEVASKLSSIAFAMQPHIRNSFRRVAIRFADIVAGRVEEQVQLNEAVIAVLLSASLVFVSVMYWNSFGELSKPLSSAWQSISSVPPGVRDSLPSMKTGVRALLTEMQLGQVLTKQGGKASDAGGGAGDGGGVCGCFS